MTPPVSAEAGLGDIEESPYALGAGWIVRADAKVRSVRSAEDGLARLHEAVSLFEKAGAQFEVGRTHLDLASICKSQGDGDSGTRHRALAEAAFAGTDCPDYQEARYHLGL